MKLDGNNLAKKVKTHCAARIKSCTDRGIRPPRLAIIQLGDKPESSTYVKWKKRDCEEIGVEAVHYHFAKRTPGDYIVTKLHRTIAELNADNSVDGIIIQLPLVCVEPGDKSDAYYTTQLCSAIASSKDVDGLHPDTFGKIANKWYRPEGHLPCTPTGIIMLLDYYGIELPQMPTVVIGRSNLVGRPLAQMLMNRDAEVTMLHSKCHPDQIWQEMKNARLIISAVGKPGIWSEDSLELAEHPTIIDVGTTVVDGKLRGDFNFDFLDHFNEMHLINYTPVPGGVGPMTRAALMYNVTNAYEYHLKKEGKILCETRNLVPETLKKEYELWRPRNES